MNVSAIRDDSRWRCVVCHEADKNGHGGTAGNSDVPIHIECTFSVVSRKGKIPDDWCCCICSGNDPKVKNGVVVHGNTEHLFHNDCLSQWLANHQTCPLCRGPILVDEQVNLSAQSIFECFCQLQPWVCAYVGRKKMDVLAISCLCNAIMGICDLRTTNQRYHDLVQINQQIDQTLNTNSQPDQEMMKRYHLARKSRNVKRMEEYDELYRFNLVRTLAMSLISAISFWKYCRK